MTPFDTTPLVLKCGTKLYRALFCDKQATCWYSTSFPVLGQAAFEPFDLRKALGVTDLREGPSSDQLRQAQTLTYIALRRDYLTALLTKTAAAPRD